MRSVAVIDYGMGNLCSVLKAWEAAGARSRLVKTPSDIDERDILVFPGQGAIVDTMKLLKDTGFDNAIRTWINDEKPFFGICLGLQALFEFSEEGGKNDCLGVFKGSVKKFEIPKQFKVPHMGWDDVSFKPNSKLLKGIAPTGEQFYFVHSYCVQTPESDIVWGTSEYGGMQFTSAILRGKLLACQFHPEKSQSKGLQLYENFLDYV